MGNTKGTCLGVLPTRRWHNNSGLLTRPVSTMLLVCILSVMSLSSEAAPQPMLTKCGSSFCNDFTQWCDKSLDICSSCEAICDPGRKKGDKAAEYKCNHKCRVYVLLQNKETTSVLTPTGRSGTSKSSEGLLNQIARKVATEEKAIVAICILMGVLVVIAVIAFCVAYKQCKSQRQYAKLAASDQQIGFCQQPMGKVNNLDQQLARQPWSTRMATPGAESVPLVSRHQPTDFTPGPAGPDRAVTSTPGYTARRTEGSNPSIHQAELESKGNEESGDVSLHSSNTSVSVHNQDTEYDRNKLHPTDSIIRDLQDQTNLNQTYTKNFQGERESVI